MRTHLHTARIVVRIIHVKTYLTVAVCEVDRFSVEKRKANSLAHVVLITRVVCFHCVADPIV